VATAGCRQHLGSTKSRRTNKPNRGPATTYTELDSFGVRALISDGKSLMSALSQIADLLSGPCLGPLCARSGLSVSSKVRSHDDISSCAVDDGLDLRLLALRHAELVERASRARCPTLRVSQKGGSGVLQCSSSPNLDQTLVTNF
jgi:hypothetical protein